MEKVNEYVSTIEYLHEKVDELSNMLDEFTKVNTDKDDSTELVKNFNVKTVKLLFQLTTITQLIAKVFVNFNDTVFEIENLEAK